MLIRDNSLLPSFCPRGGDKEAEEESCNEKN